MKISSARSFGGLLLGVITFSVGTLATDLFLTENSAKEPALAAGRFEGPGYATTPLIPSGEINDPHDLGCWGDKAEHPKFGPIRLAPEGILTTVCGTIFVKDSDGKTLWEQNVHAPLTDAPKLIDGEVVVVGYDLTLLGFDPTTGERRWETNSNGRSVYAQTAPFGTDTYALLVDMTGYESCFQGFIGIAFDEGDARKECVRRYSDEIRLRRRDEILHQWEVPAGSRIKIHGSKIFAVYRQGKTYRQIELRR